MSVATITSMVLIQGPLLTSEGILNKSLSLSGPLLAHLERSASSLCSRLWAAALSSTDRVLLFLGLPLKGLRQKKQRVKIFSRDKDPEKWIILD